MYYLSDQFLDGLIKEDIPLGDMTTESIGIASVEGRITCYPKAEGVVSGIGIASRLFEKVGLHVAYQAKDGEMRQAGEPVLTATGKAEQIHCVYKVAQNVMEYSSGISGRVREMRLQAERANPNVRIAVTRKHFPGTKMISLMAATSAGAMIHRAGLSESILIFDQHTTFAADIAGIIRQARIMEPEKKVAIEASDPEQALSFIKAGADIIQCERFSVETVREFAPKAKAVNPNVVINCAGGVNAGNAFDYAQAGADVLVTSWVYFGKPFDIKMKIEKAD